VFAFPVDAMDAVGSPVSYGTHVLVNPARYVQLRGFNHAAEVVGTSLIELDHCR
jgi:hypothetical protein